MRQKNRKLVMGLTGGIGSGKTTVAAEFSRQGCAIIDADAINHEQLDSGPVRDNLQRWWGKEVIKDNGQVDRSVVAGIVFNDAAQLKRLTDLVHPLVRQKELELIGRYQGDKKFCAIILDVPLLFESGQENLCDKVVWVHTDDEIRYQRLAQRRGWREENAKKREKSQFSLDKKAKMSDYIVYNNSTIPDLVKQVASILALIIKIK